MTDLPPISFHSVGVGPRPPLRLAVRYLPGRLPALVFLPGYMSDMAGSKAEAMLAHAAAQGRACLLLDYSGCGASEGDFADGTLGRWRDEVVALIARHSLSEVVLVGSSMGGWLMLLVAAALGDAVRGLVGIAAAPDFTEWGYTLDEKTLLADGQVVRHANPYGPEPTPTYPGFWADGQRNRVLRGQALAGILTMPARLLQGQADAEVPWRTALQLAEALGSADVQVLLIKDGDHRLSRPRDIALLARVVDDLFAAIEDQG